VQVLLDDGTGTFPYNITSKVRSYSIRPGRQNEYGAIEATQLQMRLDNTAGEFTFGKPTYNTDVDQLIRVIETKNATTSTQFTGPVDEWPTEWPNGTDLYSEVSITARDRRVKLDRWDTRSVVEEEILLDNPIAYFTFGEPAGATTAGDTSGNQAPALAFTGTGTAPTFGEGTGPGTDGLTAVMLSPGGMHLAGLAPPNVLTSVTVEGFYACAGGTGEALHIKIGDGSTEYFIVDIVQPGAVDAGVQRAATGLTPYASGSSPSTFDGSVHHFAATFDSASHTVFVYVDGLLTSSNTNAAISLPPLSQIDVWLSTTGGTELLSLAHLAIFNGLTAAQILRHATAGLTGFAGETPADRLTRYAAYIDIAPTELSLDTGRVANLVHIDTTGKTAVEAMRTVVATEGGVLFDGRDGTLTFHDRLHRYPPTTAFTLDVEAGHVAEPPEPVVDDQHQVNDLTATGATGTTGRATDAVSVSDHGWYRSTLDLATSDPFEPLDQANWLVNRYAEPILRISKVEVLLNRLPDALVALLLTATVGTRFTIAGVPVNGAGSTTLDVFVEGMTDTIDVNTHRVSLNTSPASIADAWILGDATYGVEDSTTRLHF
jgi:hypothetical protein